MKEIHLRKTAHFDERWIERVGGDPPTVKEGRNCTNPDASGG